MTVPLILRRRHRMTRTRRMKTAEWKENESILRVLAGAAFLIFFNSYLIAPLVPSLAGELNASET